MNKTRPRAGHGNGEFFGSRPPELGSLILAISPRNEAVFRFSPTRSVHASLIRRLELVNPSVSSKLHDDAVGASSSEHAWTVSPLTGPFGRSGTHLVAIPGSIYEVRVTALTTEVVQTLAASLDPSHPLGAEPLTLEWVPFDVVWERSGWESVATYASLQSAARPRRRIGLQFRSPTGFRRVDEGTEVHWPSLCLQGYLRKWNAFSGLTMPAEATMRYAANELTTCHQDLRPESVLLSGHARMDLAGSTDSTCQHLGRVGYSQKGVVGSVEWLASGKSPLLLRMVNALVKYSLYCGTGMKTSLGMGQTVPFDVPAR